MTLDRQLKQSDGRERTPQGPRLYAGPCGSNVSIGIFFRNGVLDETPEISGVSYAADGLLFEQLCDLGLDVRTTFQLGSGKTLPVICIFPFVRRRFFF